MTAEMQTEFIQLVEKMRQRQKEWSKTRPDHRSQELLAHCRKLERQVDKLLKEIHDRQGRLFA